MAKTLTIATDNFLPQYQTGSARIREILGNKSNTLNMRISVKSGQTTPQEGSEVVYKDGSRFLFGGYISKVDPVEIGIGQLFVYNAEISDYSYLFSSKIARRSYLNKTLGYIVADLMDTYVDASYGFSILNVETGPTLESVTFDHINLRKCFEKLNKITGYVWYVDYEKKLFFYNPAGLTSLAPEQVTDTSGNIEEIAISYDTSQVRNSVIVIGSETGQESLALQSDTFIGDGDKKSWVLSDFPSEVVSITLNRVSKQFSLDVNERDSDYFIYSYTGKSLQVTSASPVPGIGDSIVITYYPRAPIIIKQTDPDSITFFQALDGGDGVYEYTIKDQTITTKAEALNRAVQELEEKSMPLVDGRFKTRTGLLQAGSYFKPGQIMTVNLPTYGLSSDTAFLIQEVQTEVIENGTTTEYKYTVKFGGKIVGIQEFLENLAGEAAGDTNNVDEIKTIEQVTDSVECADSVSHSIITPPFKYGPSGTPRAVWGLSEWS